MSFGRPMCMAGFLRLAGSKRPLAQAVWRNWRVGAGVLLVEEAVAASVSRGAVASAGVGEQADESAKPPLGADPPGNNKWSPNTRRDVSCLLRASRRLRPRCDWWWRRSTGWGRLMTGEVSAGTVVTGTVVIDTLALRL